MPVPVHRLALLLILLCSSGAARAAAGEPVRYNRDIRPILSDNCFQCHGPDQARRAAKLRLDVREAAVEHGAFVPGDAAASELLRRLESTDPEEQMPPPSTHKTVSAAERDLLRRWIQQGAPYEGHWSFLPIQRPAPPELAGLTNQHPIDAFVEERRRAMGLKAAPEADRATLLRRLSLDLTGLPPSPSEVAEFERDRSRHAYERQVERLLASPHFGERMAVPWLDAVRFADTVGYHGDQNQRIFPYRDYVISAFNANKPFDEFTLEQIAGDLLPDPTLEQRIATGFNRLNMMTREGGAQPGEYLAKYQADRVRTVATAWLGVTFACAECHDHKYDPITARDFYSLSAFFADIRQWGVYQDYGYTPNPDLRGWSNDHPFPPEIEVESPALRRRLERLVEQERAVYAGATAAMRTNAAARDTYRRWRNEVREFLAGNPDGWFPPAVDDLERRDGDTFRPSTPTEWQRDPDGSIHFLGEAATDDRVVVELPEGWLAALRVEVLPARPGASGFRGTARSGNVRLSAALREPGREARPVKFAWAEASAQEPRFANGYDVPGILGGWRTPSALAAERQVGVWHLETPARLDRGTVLVIDLPGNAAARLRFSVSPVVPERGSAPASLLTLRSALGREDALWDPAVQAAFHRSTAWNPETTAALRRLAGEIRECRNGRAWTMVTVATNTLVTRVLPRGNWMDQSGPIVTPATPAFLPPLRSVGRPEGQGGGAAEEAPVLNRLDLARWLVTPENPLTARHFVNRLWAQFFGAGLSARLEDLGSQGEWPSHPELLDWLAAEFMAPTGAASPLRDLPPPHAWDVKHLVRWMVTSATYRQRAVPDERAREVDPANRWLSRQSPRRLEAEFVRDVALASSGLLVRDLGGPSVFPYQPSGYYANLQFPDRDYLAQRDERQYRRGVYVHWQRTFLHPMLANFDAPSREECVGLRLVSNTPQQALTLLNDPSFTEAARALAVSVGREADTDEERVDRLFLRVVSRPPRPSERASLVKFVAAMRREYASRPEDARRWSGDGPGDPAEQAAWGNAARVVLNLHEAITRY